MNKFAEHIKKQMGKKATVGYNAKPENMEEELAINLADEFEYFANHALEKAGLFWGGYSGEEERRERVEVAKKAIRPLISNNFKKNVSPKFYDLVIEHLTDTNSHIVVSAIEEVMKEKQASKRAKVTKKAFTYEDEKAALAKFLNVKENKIDETENPYNSYTKLNSYKVGNEIYTVSADTDQILQEVADSMENLFNELKLDEFLNKVIPYIGNGTLERYFSVRDSKLEDEAMYKLEDEGIEEPTEEQIEKAKQEIIDNYGSAESYYLELDTEYIKDMIENNDAFIDFEKMAEDVINQYGAGHELSSYDNSTEEVEYNGKTYYIFRQAKKSKKMNKLADIIRREINKSAGSIDYEVMMDIPQNSNVKKEDIIDEIQHLGDTYNLGLDDMYDFQPNHTITFTLPMEKANKLISELENLGFRLLRREKKDNRTQYEWERDQKIYD